MKPNLKLLSQQLLSTVAADVAASHSGIADVDRANMVDANATAGKVPKAKAGKIVVPAHVARIDAGIKLLESVCTAKQMQAMEAFAADAYDRQAEADAWDVSMDAHIRGLLGETKRLNAATYFPMVKGIRMIFGAYPATCFRNAVKRAQGALPTKRDKRAKGTIKGYSPRKWLRGIDSTLDEFAERTAKVAQIQHDIPAAALREFMDAVRRLQSAHKRIARAINE